MTCNSIVEKARSNRNEKPEPWKIFARRPEVPWKVLPVDGSCLGWGLQTFCTSLSSISSKTRPDVSFQIKARWDFVWLQVRSPGLSRVLLPDLRQWNPLPDNADYFFFPMGSCKLALAQFIWGQGFGVAGGQISPEQCCVTIDLMFSHTVGPQPQSWCDTQGLCYSLEWYNLWKGLKSDTTAIKFFQSGHAIIPS